LLTARVLLTAAALSMAAAARAQMPAPQPAAPDTAIPGFITRTAVGVGLAHLTAGDPVFNYAARFKADMDLAEFGWGRVNLFGDYEAIFGTERRVFDLNHENYSVDLSVSYRARSTELFAVLHHVSRHLSDRENDRAVAWNSIGVAAERSIARGGTQLRGRVNVAKVFQHTFNDYSWSAWLTVEARRPAARRLELYAKGAGGLLGVDGRAAAPRDRQCGARLEAGTRVLGAKGGVDVYLAYERRIDGYPLAPTRTRWVEFGFRLGN
jgi:hypothetical protein